VGVATVPLFWGNMSPDIVVGNHVQATSIILVLQKCLDMASEFHHGGGIGGSGSASDALSGG